MLIQLLGIKREVMTLEAEFHALMWLRAITFKSYSTTILKHPVDVKSLRELVGDSYFFFLIIIPVPWSSFEVHNSVLCGVITDCQPSPLSNSKNIFIASEGNSTGRVCLGPALLLSQGRDGHPHERLKNPQEPTQRRELLGSHV